ncbi:thiol-disulfide isomerase/thioredoxin [Pedobacter africanus]|uniref:Thiol-disulfide isomerase/thioredoxin n=1 Tax=Pedobacter africanus TaxID=151894 RepID=A0ACC6KW05_9SPHI|nr:TlpA disulfide reductase family protein [Pedobacter africanus]MDR6783417.1 thiol-disulfide isomerase/thioredoxin [Pedobacter africanus]
MKTIVTLITLITLSFAARAQKDASMLKDDLVPDKNKTLAKYLPIGKEGYFYRFYIMPVEEMQQKLEAAKVAMLSETNKQSDPVLKTLMEKDVDFAAREALKQFVSLYGMDSVGMKSLEKVLVEKKGDPNFTKYLMEAQSKAFAKKLPAEERTRLMGRVYENPELDNEALFKRSAAYRSWISNYITYLRTSKYRADTTLGYAGTPLVKLKVVNAEVPAGFIKNYLNYQLTGEVLKMVKDSAAKENTYRNFMATASNPEYKKDIESIFANYKMMQGNALSPEFNFADVNGKLVSLKSLRGKYVYIDVWATWCAPCKAEIPFLQKVEHDYEGKNIHFVSLSVDRMSDKAKWVSYVKDNKLGGIQLMSDKDFSADFVKKYNINSIPRFILIDPAGKIVDGDAKRPSDAKLRAQFDRLLK